MTDALRGARLFLEGLRLAFRPGVRRWALAPMAVSALLYGGLFWFAASRFGGLVASLHEAMPEWLRWLDWILWVVFWALAILLCAFTFVIVASVVASPFNGPLAEAAEKAASGRVPPSGAWYRTVTGLPRMVVQEVKKVLYAIFWAVPFLALFWIPGVNVVAPVLWFLFNAWITAIAFTDYAMDNNGLLFHQMRRLLRRRLALSMGFGATAFVALTIPILNLFAVPGAVCGGTLLWTRFLRDGVSRWSKGAGSGAR